VIKKNNAILFLNKFFVHLSRGGEWSFLSLFIVFEKKLWHDLILRVRVCEQSDECYGSIYKTVERVVQTSFAVNPSGQCTE
jgi:hypothetical protein